MPDVVTPVGGGLEAVRRFKEVRPGEYAPEVSVAFTPFPVAPAPVVSHATAAAATNAWTTIASRTVPAGGPAEDVEAFNCDIAGIFDVGMRVRLLIGGVTVWQETLGTRSNSATYPKMRAAAGQVVAVQAFHAEATAQDVAATIVTRPLT